MSALAWWLVPIGATIVAIGWVSWASRPKPPADVHATLESYERFRRALGTPPPASRDVGEGAERHDNAAPEGEPEGEPE